MTLDEMNLVLDRVAAAFRRLQTDLQDPATERWRWGVPEISLTWREVPTDVADYISKSIRAYVHDAEVGQSLLRAEANAWRDEPSANGSLERHWRHAEIGHVSEIYDQSQIDALINQAYQQVSKWDRNSLTRIDPLPPSPGRRVESREPHEEPGGKSATA